MAPIRVGFAGLSAKSGWSTIAHLPYLLSPRGREKYEIVALLNTSVAAARAAIQHYGLPSATRAYGRAVDLAADPDVDLVVCCTRVDTHHAVTKSALEAGKDVLVEWPLAANIEQNRELAELARAKGVRTAVVAQRQLAAPQLKLKELIDDGLIGKMVSVEVKNAGGVWVRDSFPKSLSYLASRAIGGTPYTIGFGHMFSQLQAVHGSIRDETVNLHQEYPMAKILGSDNEVLEEVRKEHPDLILLTGRLPESSTTRKNATISIRYRQGQPFPGEPFFVWQVNGEKGELRLTASKGNTFVDAMPDPSIVLEHYDHATDKVHTVDWSWEDWQTHLAAPGVGKVYDLFAEGATVNGVAVQDFETALERHEQLDKYVKDWWP